MEGMRYSTLTNSVENSAMCNCNVILVRLLFDKQELFVVFFESGGVSVFQKSAFQISCLKGGTRQNFRGQTLNTNFSCFRKHLGHLRDILAKIPGYSAKKFVFPGFEDIPNILTPTPSRRRSPPQRKMISETKRLS